MHMENIVEKIYAYMSDKNLSENKFAEIVGVNQSTIWRILRGKNMPSFKTYQKILDKINSHA